MSAPQRFEQPGAIHHVTNRGPRKGAMFGDDRDRIFYLRRLIIVCQRRDWRCLAYCLMTNHVHLVVETMAETLGHGMRDLHSLTGRVSNARHGHVGATVEARYGSSRVHSDEYLAQLLRYVALNPVKAGMVDAPGSWPWSSHSALIGERPDPCVDVDRVAELLEPWGGPPAGRYARLFDARGQLAERYGDDHPANWRPALTDLLRPGADLVTGIRAARAAGYRQQEIADHLDISQSTVSRWTARA